MILIASVRLALERLRANAARSALTVLGIVIGVGSVVTLVAVGNGSAAEVNRQFSGLGIANVMLVAVRERTQEIGIRRAIGAKRRDIVAQFLTEATVLSLLGGLLGVAAGLGLAFALPHLSDQRTLVSYPAGALALFISAVVGIVAGLGPANQAASLDPAEAPRYE